MSIKVLIRTMDKILYEDECTTLTTFNDVGTLDILEQHANFISLIKNYITLNIGTNTEQTFKFDQGVLRVRDNKVEIYINK